MPIKKTAGVHGFYVEIEESLFKRLEVARKPRGELRRKVIEDALKRHLANLPPIEELPPLPPASPPAPPTPKPKKKGK